MRCSARKAPDYRLEPWQKILPGLELERSEAILQLLALLVFGPFCSFFRRLIRRFYERLAF